MSQGAQTTVKVEGKPLVSRSSILIFSAILIGMVTARTVSREWQFTVHLIGLFGLLSYFGLSLLAERRQQSTAERALERASSDLEHRFDRHIRHPSLSKKQVRGVNSLNIERQYLTVANSNRRLFRR